MPATDDPFAMLTALRIPAHTRPTPAGDTLDLDTGPTRPPSRRNWPLIVAALYGPDLTVTELAHGRAAGAHPRPSAGDPPVRASRPSRLPKSVITSRWLPEARHVSDHLLAAVHRTRTPGSKAIRATNSWLEYADQLMRVHGYTRQQLCAVIDWCSGKGFTATWITSTYQLHQHAGRLFAEPDVQAHLLAAGAALNPQQQAGLAATTAAQTGRRATRPAQPPTPGSGASTWGPSGAVAL